MSDRLRDALFTAVMTARCIDIQHGDEKDPMSNGERPAWGPYNPPKLHVVTLKLTDDGLAAFVEAAETRSAEGNRKQRRGNAQRMRGGK